MTEIYNAILLGIGALLIASWGFKATAPEDASTPEEKKAIGRTGCRTMIVIRKDKTVNSEILPYLAHVRLSPDRVEKSARQNFALG
jgi:hypothetical protein